ncbi:MAG: hypothetical protein K6U77_12650 [Armatimonadetes bacterium]|nr:hypothetical protein [Armatimonadota bacterium]
MLRNPAVREAYLGG